MVKGWSNFDMVGHLMMAFFIFCHPASCNLITIIFTNEIIFCGEHHSFFCLDFAYYRL